LHRIPWRTFSAQHAGWIADASDTHLKVQETSNPSLGSGATAIAIPPESVVPGTGLNQALPIESAGMGFGLSAKIRPRCAEIRDIHVFRRAGRGSTG